MLWVVTSRLPSLDDYVAMLPDGLDSFPEAKAKASLYRSTVEHTLLDDVDLLPPALRPLITDPVPVSSWIPEVHSHAMILVCRDVAFESDEEFIEFTYQQQRALFSGRLYRIMLALASPSVLFRTAAMRWKSFHRGSSFTVEHWTSTSAQIRIEHPPGLWHGVLSGALLAGLRAVLDLSGAQNTRLEIAEHAAEHMRLVGSWTV